MTLRLLLPLALLLAAAPLAAQDVTGRLTERGSGRPIEGAVVVLIDSAGAQRAGRLTGADGVFRIPAPGPGRYRLQAERIGFASTRTEPFALGPGEEARRDLVASTEAIELRGVEVEGDRRCVVRPADGMRAASLWEEARKALNAAALTEAQRLVRFRIRSYDRRLDPYLLLPQEEDSRVRTHLGSAPFHSLPADDLARGGYVRPDGDGWMYYAPDAGVLLSDAFLDTHCFRVRSGQRESHGLVGLAFEPVRRQRVPDIEGVLWMDPESAELRWVEFRYTGVLRREGAAQQGRVEYERLPGGAWIVRRWWIRMPILGRDPAEARTRVIGIKETGGEVEELLTSPRRR